MPLDYFERVTIIGTGLIGGSWGLAIRRAGFRGTRVGCDRPETLEKALSSGAIDAAEPDPLRAVSGSQLVILAAPVGEILRLLAPLSRAVSGTALVTDTGSTKAVICEEAARHFKGGCLFLGGHPMAGKEKSGIESASARLFENAAYVLVPPSSEREADPRAAAFGELISAVGAHVVTMTARSHDRAMAYLSHLPQLASTALASVIEEREDLPLDIAASGLRDVTRLAGSPYDVWRDICATNLENVGAALDLTIAKLQFIRTHLAQNALEIDFRRAQNLHARLWTKV